MRICLALVLLMGCFMQQDEAVTKAAGKLRDAYPSFNRDLFDRVTVKNGWVRFDMSYKYVPQNSSWRYSAAVQIDGDAKSTEILSNPSDRQSEAELEFFKPDRESKKAIAFFNKALGIKSLTVNTAVIRDNPDFYAVEVFGEGNIQSYKLDKKSGRIYDSSEGILAPAPPAE